MNNELTAKEEDFLLEEARELGSLKKEVESAVKSETATLELEILKQILLKQLNEDIRELEIMRLYIIISAFLLSCSLIISLIMMW